MDRSKATFEVPLLNMDTEYVSEAGRTREDDEAISFDTASAIRQRVHISSTRFDQIFRETISFYTEQERYYFRQLQSGDKPVSDFERNCAGHLKRNYQELAKNQNDFTAMMNRLMLAIFRYDVLQPLIDHPDMSDIKVCAPDDIRVRIHGKAYKSNANFIDVNDLKRFVEGILIRNGIDMERLPVVTFTDTHDENYILRFSVSAPFVNAVDYPYLHIRKVPKSKPHFDELIRRDMLTEKVKAYLIDRAKLSRGIVFAGPPGSGKTTALNAFIEYIPKTRETLVIQENDELQTEQSGFMFKHVSHGFMGEPVCTLEDLGKIALVEGCNEFIIGEVKGGEMRYAMTLLNAGGYAALTVHSTNAFETLDKLADLVKYGSSYTFQEARRMLKTFDTVVYMENYKIRDILEVAGYDDKTDSYIYVPIYKYQGNN